MLDTKMRDVFMRLGMDYPAVAVKFCFNKPEGVEHVDAKASFCQFLKKAQSSNQAFYMTAEDDDCFGRMVLGMIDKPPFAASDRLVWISVYLEPKPPTYGSIPKSQLSSVAR